MEKRVYRSGYHIEWTKGGNNPGKQKSANNNDANKTGTDKTLTQKGTIVDNDRIGETVTASKDNSIITLPNKTTAIVKNGNADKQDYNKIDFSEECDLIILNNGEEIMSKVVLITREEIKYKKCDKLDGPSYPLKKSDVHMIRYPNGTQDIFTSVNSTTDNTTSSTSNKTKPKALGLARFLFIAGLLFSLIGIFLAASIESVLPFFFGPLWIIFGLISLRNIKRYPYKNSKGRRFAIWSIILGGLTTLLILIIYWASNMW